MDALKLPLSNQFSCMHLAENEYDEEPISTPMDFSFCSSDDRDESPVSLPECSSHSPHSEINSTSESPTSVCFRKFANQISLKKVSWNLGNSTDPVEPKIYNHKNLPAKGILKLRFSSNSTNNREVGLSVISTVKNCTTAAHHFLPKDLSES